jgi:hypothetical protein
MSTARNKVPDELRSQQAALIAKCYKRRKELGWTRTHLAAICDLNTSQITKIEHQTQTVVGIEEYLKAMETAERMVDPPCREGRDPDEHEIAAEAAKIRSNWSEYVHQQRSRWAYTPPVTVQEFPDTQLVPHTHKRVGEA